MALYRHVRSEFWVNPKISENMDHKEKLIYIYLLTNSHTTQIGIYKITKRQISYDVDLPIDIVNEILHKFENEYNMIVYKDKTHEIAIRNWGKYNLNNNGKPVIDCIKKELEKVKDCELLKVVSSNIKKVEIKTLFDKAYDLKIKEFDDNAPCTMLASRGQKEKEKEKEKEKQKENKKEIHKNKNKNSNVLGKYAKLYTENIGVINGVVSEWLIEISNSTDLELFKRALEIATNQNKCSKGYVNGIINQWLNKNIKTIEDLKAYELQENSRVQENINKNSNLRSINFRQEDESLYSKPSEEEIELVRAMSKI